MELWPPDLSDHDEQEQPADEPRGYWVAEVLGEDWKTDGDGIYRYAPERGSALRPMPDPALVWLLECGHDVRLVEHERPDEPPQRPRLCPLCGKLRRVVVQH